MSIQPLPPEVATQIKSSSTISSLNGVVSELFKNALDASCSKVEIDVNYSRGSCVIEDDGLGIAPTEFRETGGLGKLHHSSRLNNSCSYHGSRGSFLASLSAVSLLTITSHHHLHYSHNTLTIHDSQVISRQLPAITQHLLTSRAHGTRVIVMDLFGSMPVRVKQRSLHSNKHGGSTKEWESLKKEVVSLLLAWPRVVTAVIKESGTNQKFILHPRTSEPQDHVINIKKVHNIFSQAMLVPPGEQNFWVHITASTSDFHIHGTIHLHPSPTKHAQFLAFGIQPVLYVDGHNVLHDEINRLFQNSAFGNVEDGSELNVVDTDRRSKDGKRQIDAFTNKELRGRKGVDRWPIYYINIRRRDSSYNSVMHGIDETLDNNAGSLGKIVNLLQTMVVEFLTKHHFRPKARSAPFFARDTKYKTESIFQPQNVSSLKPVDYAEGRISSDSKTSHFSDLKSSCVSSPALDPLGTNLKLPSFQRLSSLASSPFNSWPRVKSGSGLKKTRNAKGPSSPAIHSSRAQLHSFNSTLALPVKTCGRMITSDGKVLRRPFVDEDILQPQRTTLDEQPTAPQLPNSDDSPTMVSHEESTSDGVMIWLNSITKIESHVDRRTGLTKSTEEKSSLPPGLSGKALRLSALPNFSSKMPLVTKKSSRWLSSILENWDNPTFQLTEPSIPRIPHTGDSERILHGHQNHCSQLDIDKAFNDSSSGISGRISKDALRRAEVISQVDKKFILIKLKLGIDMETSLVLIDQHAADERIRIEDLLAEQFDHSEPINNSITRVITTSLSSPLIFNLTDKEIDLFRKYHDHFTSWGLIYNIDGGPNPGVGSQNLVVQRLPVGISERCKADPRSLIQLLRSEAWKIHTEPRTSFSPALAPGTISENSWLTNIHNFPQGILDMLNSRACRSAIMFNDDLTAEQCATLVKRLANCSFPFQCAHGRPSMVPLVDLGSVWSGLGRKGVGDGNDAGDNLGNKLQRWSRHQI